MSIWLTTISSLGLPLAVLAFPGLTLLPFYANRTVLEKSARVIIASLIFNSLGSLLLAWFNQSPALILLFAFSVTLISLAYHYKQVLKHQSHWHFVLLASIWSIVFSLFALPYLLLHNGLPTGDVQKSLYWANQINQQPSFPNYSDSIHLLNRDPSDFFTPALHSLTASVTFHEPLLSSGFLAIALTLSIGLVITTLAQSIFPKTLQNFTLPLGLLLLLSQFRFLRYLREPGYHFQNIIGELWLWASLLLFLSLLKKWRWLDAVLLAGCLISLILSHQFSAFLSGFILIPAFLALIYNYRNNLKQIIWLPVGLFSLALLISYITRLHTKLSNFFTTDPHLLPLTPQLSRYPNLMGSIWITLGILGLILMSYSAFKKRSQNLLIFTTSAWILLILSQGPRIGIDIPPVRALFYTAVPLSLTAAYFLTLIWTHTRQLSIRICLLLLVIIGIGTSISQAYSGLPSSARTNSTLRVSHLDLINYITATASSSGILVDGYNQRASDWLLLSNQPLFNRIAADVSRSQQESVQSDLRRKLYLNQLDYEKIFSLGNTNLVSPLLDKHQINFVVGVENSSQTSFASNPSLFQTLTTDDLSLFETIPVPANITGLCSELDQSQIDWLLRTSTLTNDIGDREDTFEHLPASLRTANLSQPTTNHTCTFRETTAPVIPVRFNVRDYVNILWDQESTQQSDTPLQFLISFADDSSLTSLRTNSGKHYRLEDNQPTILTSEPFDEDGFITLYLLNPNRQSVKIDLIALGLSPIL